VVKTLQTIARERDERGGHRLSLHHCRSKLASYSLVWAWKVLLQMNVSFFDLDSVPIGTTYIEGNWRESAVSLLLLAMN